jgi:crossover junction endodeoxyribonuclease RuvC
MWQPVGVAMRVMGLDPGSRKTGYGIVTLQDGHPVRVDSGVLCLGNGSLESRLERLHQQLQQVVIAHQPTVCAVEGVFQHRNPRSALILGHARGVCLLAAALHDLEVVEYPPATVKRAITGHGAADKQSVGSMVARLLRTAPEVSEDAADALAVALCHLESHRPLRVFE